MTDLYVNDDIGPINNDDVDRRAGVPPDLSPPPTRPSLHDQILTAANIGIYATQEESECMICSEPFKVDQTVTILKHCKPRSHFFHNFCVWDIVHIGIPDRRKLKERISSQAARILADQPPDSRLTAFTGRCSLAFRNEADRARSFYAPSPTTIIYTANDVHPDDMIMVKCIVANFDRSFYMWLARDRDMVEAGTKWQKIVEPRWTMDITASRPFFELPG